MDIMHTTTKLHGLIPHAIAYPTEVLPLYPGLI